MATRLDKKATSLQRRLRSTLEEATALLATDCTPRQKLQASLATLEAYSARLEAVIDDLPPPASADGGAASQEKDEDTDDPYDLILICDEVKARLKVGLETILPTTTDNVTSPSSSKHTVGAKSVTLPKLVIPTFDGNVLKWQEFWDSFSSSIHSNEDLTPVDKFNYLNSLLVGEAKLCISRLPLTSLNYDSALSLLKDRFANKPIIINSHYKALIAIPPIDSDNTRSLRYTYDLIQKHLRCLQALGEDTNSNYFVTLITSKLPLTTLMKIEEHNLGTDMDVTGLCSTLQNIILAREKSEMILGISDTSNRTVPSLPSKRSNDALATHDRRRREPNSTAQALTTNNGAKNLQRCIFCDGNHWSDECSNFKTVSERKEKVKGLCFICLQRGHNLKNCRSSKPCVYCKQRQNHHRSLCPKQFPEQSSKSQMNSNETSLVNVNERVILQTATVQATNTGRELRCTARLVLDTGSQRSYVTKSLASKLQLKSEQQQILNVFTFGNKTSRTLETPIVKIGIHLLDGDNLSIHANVVPHITGKVNSSGVLDLGKIKQLYPNLVLAQGQDMDSDIDILIGNDYYLDLINDKKIEISKGLYLMSTKLGWIVTGRDSTKIEETNSYSTSFLTTVKPNNLFIGSPKFLKPDSSVCDDDSIKNLWRLETIGIRDDPHVKDDDIAVANFNQTIKFENGRYSVTWPWKDYPPNLPTNYKLSLGRLKSLTERLSGKPELLSEYDSIIQNQLTAGIVERVSDSNSSNVDGVVHYVPHHPVITESKASTKLRIVYDASAKTKRNNNSLNDCLYRGPVILENLCSLLLRFRMNAVGITADIEKAFLQINLQTSDRDVTRFLWLKDPLSAPTNENIVEYRFCRVPFGVISSPFLLSATIVHHLSQSHLDRVSERLKTSFYVDNMVTGCDTVDEATQLFVTASSLFSDINMNLRCWCSNSKALMDQIPAEKTTTENLTSVNLLGLKWNTELDTLHIKPISCDKRKTVSKREVLSTTSSIFDPLGLVSPVTLKAKLFLKQLWEENLNWDETLSEQRSSEWETILDDILKISEISVPRYAGLQSDNIELHCFTDASKDAYACVVYLHYKEAMKTTLMFSKSHLTPKSNPKITLPRLELLGVLIGIRALRFVETSLGYSVANKFLWTDSQCVLHWLTSTKLLPKFVERRITEIKADSKTQFKYVPTLENPADMATRGKSAEDLNNCKEWWMGPHWLTCEEDMRPKWSTKLEETLKEEQEDEDVSVPVAEVVTLTQEPTSSSGISPFGIDINKFSSLDKLIRTTAYCERAIKAFKKLPTSESVTLNRDELLNSTLKWVRHVQQHNFEETLENMKIHRTDQYQRQFGLFLDGDGILRCGGRLLNTDLSPEVKFPVLLPKNNHFTSLVIQNYHVKLQHVGVQHTLSEIRKHYWIVQGRSQVSKNIRKCPVCKRWDSGTYKLPPSPPLPSERVTVQLPFSYTGLDYFGPLYVKIDYDSVETRKVYGCIFTCLTVRAIHLELVNDMTATEFLLAFRRFVSRRGKPKEIYLDNAPQFKLASSLLETVWNNNFQDDDVLSYASGNSIKFNFIPEFSPWMGGFYERLISITKKCLKKTIGQLKLTFTQLETVLCETESILNSRPLIYVSSDELCLDDNALTPGHFLNFHGKNGFMPDIINQDPNKSMKFLNITGQNVLELWKRGERMLGQFWKTWTESYLASLRERKPKEINQKRGTSNIVPKLGQLVLIHDDLPRGRWKMARITDLHPSKDGQVRRATVYLSNKKKLVRPMNLLYPIEVSH